MAIEKIDTSSKAYTDCLHSKQPDVPKRTAEETKMFFDSMAESVLVPKINEIVSELPNKADSETLYSAEQVDSLIENNKMRYTRLIALADVSDEPISGFAYLGYESSGEDSVEGELSVHIVGGNIDDTLYFDIVNNATQVQLTLTTNDDSTVLSPGDCFDLYSYFDCPVDARIMLTSCSGNYNGIYVFALGALDPYTLGEFSYTKHKINALLDKKVNTDSVYSKDETSALVEEKTTYIAPYPGVKFNDGFYFLANAETLTGAGYQSYGKEYPVMQLTLSNGESKVVELRSNYDGTYTLHATPWIWDVVVSETTQTPVYIDITAFGAEAVKGVTIASVSTPATEYISLTNVSEPGQRYANALSLAGAARVAQKKTVEVGDEITVICYDEYATDELEITVDVTMSCGHTFTDTLKCYRDEPSSGEFVMVVESQYNSAEGGITANKVNLLALYLAKHADATQGSCYDGVYTESVVVTGVATPQAYGVYVITAGNVTMSLLLDLGII